jgi:hypothetical protein
LSTFKFIKAKLAHRYIWRRIFLERLTEPLHLNLISLFVALFGSYTNKIFFDLVIRPYNAYSILQAARQCRRHAVSKLAICEFGVANGAGLINMAMIARKISKLTGVDIRVWGFDTGTGMPPSVDYRDHPELYAPGDFKMNVDLLTSRLPDNADLLLGEITATAPKFIEILEREGWTLGYVVIDVDYYSSCRDALEVLKGRPQTYLPSVFVYLDDVEDPNHNPSAGELLAIQEFNVSNHRKIHRDEFLVNRRVFKNANWIKHMYYLHVFDHPHRIRTKETYTELTNPYL